MRAWLSLFAVLFFAEAASADKFTFREEGKHGFYRKAPRIGWEAIPSVSTDWKKYDGDRLLFDVQITIDEFGRRVSKQSGGKKDLAVLFFGDSNTFGEGLNSEATLPSIVASLRSHVRVYNYAFRGYGPNQFFIQVEDIDFAKQVQEPKGYVAYMYHPFLLQRLVGTSESMWYAYDAPYLAEEDGRIVYKGSFIEARPYLTEFYIWFGQSWIARRYLVAYPRIRRSHYELLCKTMAQAKDTLKTKLPGYEFLFVNGPDLKGGHEIMECMQEKNVRVLDLRTAFEGEKLEDLSIPFEGHHSERAHRILARRFIEALGL